MDDIVRKYIDEVAALQTRQAETLSPEDLADIAREVGLGDADVEAIDGEVAARLVRARNFAANELWDDALTEIESVTALAPHRTDAIELRARILAGRWKADGRDQDRVQALELSRQVIARDPDHLETYRLIKELAPPRLRWTHVAGAATAAVFGSIVVWSATSSMLALGPILIVVAILAALGGRASRPRNETGALPAPESFAGLLTNDSAEARLSDHSLADRSDLKIPLELDNPAAWEEVTLRVRQRSADSYPDSTYARVVLEIRPTRPEQIDGLKARITVEEDGEEIFAVDRELLDAPGRTPALPDRPAVVDVLLAHEAASHPTKIRMELLAISRASLPPFGDPIPVEPTWDVPRAERFELTFRYRGETSGNATMWRHLWWEVENTGKWSVDKLTCQTMIVGESGEVLTSRIGLVTYQNRVLLPGETRLARMLAEVPDEPWSFALTVTELD